jgi:hypothetical protein
MVTYSTRVEVMVTVGTSPCFVERVPGATVVCVEATAEDAEVLIIVPPAWGAEASGDVREESGRVGAFQAQSRARSGARKISKTQSEHWKG